MKIHPTAIIEPGAKIGVDVVVGPYTVIESNVEIGDRCEIGPHVQIAWGTRLGARSKVFHGATLGTIPQDLKFENEETLCRIGEDCIIRENVSINRGTKASGVTSVGNNCAILAYCHIGHDCVVGNNLVVSNNLAMAGHVIVGNHVTIGGVCAFHQFTHIGDHVMVGAFQFITQDIVPFALVGDKRIAGVNSVGLERRGFSEERRRFIKRAYKILFREGLSEDAAVERLTREFPGNEDIGLIVKFVKESTRGLMRMESD